MYYTTTTSESLDTSAVAGLGVAYLIIGLIVAVLLIVAEWKIFTKAGKPGWHSIIPLLNLYDLFEIAGYSGWMFLTLLIPCVGWIFMILMLIKLAKAFGKGTGFAIGLIFLTNIFLLILGFGSAQYVGTQQQQ